jgi:surfeit locus 1 family protein
VTGGIRRLLVPALSALAMLLLLLGLGTWQLHRLAWKRGLLAQIDAAERAPAIPLPPAPPPFAKVRAAGRLRPDLAALYGAEVREARGGPVLGGQLIVPLERPGAAPLLVDLGWVPGDRPGQRSLPAAETTVEGFLHPADHPGWFAAPDNPVARQFYTLDPAAIGAALGLPAVLPYTLVVLGPPGLPDPARHLPRPPNDHLQYALTWFGLAGALIVIFSLYVRKVYRA